MLTAVIANPATNFAQWQTENYSILSPFQKVALDVLAAFGEAIVYQPLGGAARSITAVVNYGTVSKMSPMPNGFGPQMTVSVFNHASYGVTAVEANAGGDLFLLPTRIGGTPQSRRMTKINHQDEGMIVFEVR
jgi:hypothetical protein